MDEVLLAVIAEKVALQDKLELQDELIQAMADAYDSLDADYKKLWFENRVLKAKQEFEESAERRTEDSYDVLDEPVRACFPSSIRAGLKNPKNS